MLDDTTSASKSKPNPADSIIERVDQLVKDDQITTRTGLKLLVPAFRDGLVLIADVSSKVDSLQSAYVRFTNTMAKRLELEETNNKLLTEMKPFFYGFKWLVVAFAGLLVKGIWDAWGAALVTRIFP